MPRRQVINRTEYPRVKNPDECKPSASTLAKDWLNAHDALYVPDWDCFVVRKPNETAYRVLAGEKFARALSAWCDFRFPSQRITQAYCRDAAWCAATLIREEHSVEPPTKHAAFSDCLLDLRTMETVPSGTAPTVIGFDLSYVEVMKSEGKLWDEYLRTAFVATDGETPDPALLASFKETCGTLLLASRKPSCAVFLYGPTAGNGKSTFLDVMRGVFGRDLTSALSLSSLVDNRFASAHLLGKRFNFCGEVGTRYARHDLFKSVVTGDLIPAERKHGAHFEFVPEVSMWFAVNSYPTFEGVDDGLMRRIRAYPMRADFRGAKGKDGLAARILASERGAVVRWLVEAARTLHANGCAFSVEADAAIAGTMEGFQRESSAVMRFASARGWRHSPAASPVRTADIYSDYVRWCGETNCKPMNEHNFTGEFRRVTRCGETFDWRHPVRENGTVRTGVFKSLRVAQVSSVEDAQPTLPIGCTTCSSGQVCVEHQFT